MDGLLRKESRVVVSGGAGCIGFHLCRELLKQGVQVAGLDNLNDYYDVSLKEYRLKQLASFRRFRFYRCDLADEQALEQVFKEVQPELVVNLAAQAGVRYSIDHPRAYINSNIIGFFNVLEACRQSLKEGNTPVRHLVFASSSSVYGINRKVPYSVSDQTDWPVSLYAATKKSDELLAYSYSKLYGIRTTGLRSFTVYGPMGRPDMAYFKFTDRMVRGEKIQVYNYGDMYRDFTYIDDIVKGTLNVMDRAPSEDERGACYRIYNIGNHKPESLMRFLDVLEESLLKAGVLQKKGERELLPMQPGDVYQTFADVEDLKRDFGFAPETDLREGLERFARWYKEYYG